MSQSAREKLDSYYRKSIFPSAINKIKIFRNMIPVQAAHRNACLVPKGTKDCVNSIKLCITARGLSLFYDM